MNLFKLHISAGLLLFCSASLYASGGSVRDAESSYAQSYDSADSYHNESFRFELDCVEAILDNVQRTPRRSRGRISAPDRSLSPATGEISPRFWLDLERRKSLNFALFDAEDRIFAERSVVTESRAAFASASPWRDVRHSSGDSMRAGIQSRTPSIAPCVVDREIIAFNYVSRKTRPGAARRNVDVRAMLHLHSIRNGSIHGDGLRDSLHPVMSALVAARFRVRSISTSLPHRFYLSNFYRILIDPFLAHQAFFGRRAPDTVLFADLSAKAAPARAPRAVFKSSEFSSGVRP